VSQNDLRKAIRTAIVALLDGDDDPYDDPYKPGAVKSLQTLAPGIKVTYRPTRKRIVLPAITMFDGGSKIDDVVPLYQRDHQIDVWSVDLDQAEDIAHRIQALLDHQPLPLPGEEGQVVFLMLTSDSDGPVEDADVARKTLTFRLLCYEYNGPAPFGENP
jgi:hypothetical protein